MNNADNLRARFGIKFSLLARQWRRVMQAHLARSGMTDTAWVPLMHLRDHPDGILLKELSLLVGVDSSSLVRVIDKLDRDGLVERKRDETDARAKQILLTQHGHQQVAAIQQQLAIAELDILGGLTDEDIVQMSASLRHIQQKLTDFEHAEATPHKD